MPWDFASRLHAFAGVIVRVGLNLQPEQRLLIAEPYELQGVARSAEILVEAVRTMALEAGCPHPASVDVIWGDGAGLRKFAGQADWRGWARLVAANARIMDDHVRQGDALLFLQGSQPRLMDGIAPANIAELHRIGWEHFGPIAQQLVAGATNWTVAPAPAPAWAKAVYSDLPQDQRLAALWDDVFQACRVGPALAAVPPQGLSTSDSPTETAVAAWQSHLQSLQGRCDELNRQQIKTLRYLGDGTDLTVALPPEHVWCTAQMTTRSGVSFVANLPTEEVFTLPHKDSAEGNVRVSGPVSHGGTVIDGIELEFKHGRVVRANARLGSEVLQRLLETDEGAARLGEVALIGNVEGSLSPDLLRSGPSAVAKAMADKKAPPTKWQNSGRLFRHPLLDENISNHVALGEAYPFCLRSPNPAALNRSLIHVDLPLNARTAISS